MRIIITVMINCFKWIAYVGLAAMTLLTFADVTGRFFLHKAVLGNIELTELIMAVFGGLAIFLTATQGGHIAVDVVFDRFPRLVQTVITSFSLIIGAVTWGIIAYQIIGDGQSKIALGRITDVHKIPVGPFEFALAAGVALFSLTLVIQIFRPLRGQKEKGQTTL